MSLEDGETRPITRYHRERLVSSIPYYILHQYFTHSLYVYAGETIMPPRVLACGGNKQEKQWP